MKDIDTIQAAAFIGMLAFGSLLTIILIWYFKGSSERNYPAHGPADFGDEHRNVHFTTLPAKHRWYFDRYPHMYDTMLSLPAIGSTVLYSVGQNFEKVLEFLESYPVGGVRNFPAYAVPLKSMDFKFTLPSSVDAVHTLQSREVFKISKVSDTVEVAGLILVPLEDGTHLWCAQLKIVGRHTVTISTERSK